MRYSWPISTILVILCLAGLCWEIVASIMSFYSGRARTSCCFPTISSSFYQCLVLVWMCYKQL